jgi:hypothetical protein
MMRLTYLIVVAIFLAWATTLSPEHGSGPPEWLLTHLGSILAAIVCSFVALIGRKWRASGNFLLLGVGLIVGDCASFAYRLNNVCGPGDRIIKSEADAIKQAKARTFEAHYITHGIAGYVDEKPAVIDFDHTDNCCKVTRSRNIYGVIIWKVDLDGETIGEPRNRLVGVNMSLSNCGAVFSDDSFISAEPKRNE